MKLFITLLLIFNISNATCNQSVTYLTEGSITKCTGYLFTEEKELEVRTKVDKVELLESLVKNQDQQIDILNQRVKLAQEQNLNLEKFLQNRIDTNLYVNIAFFIGGALITAFISANVNK